MPFRLLHYSLHITMYGGVHKGPDLFGTCAKLVRISLVFTQDLLLPIRIRSAVWYQMGPLMKMKVIPYGTVPFQFRTGSVKTGMTPQVIRTIADPIPNISDPV